MVGRGGFLLRAVPPLRRSLDQVVAHAAVWERRTQQLLAAGPVGDPLWAVLGDSTAQGVGLADVDRGYVGRVRALLEERDGRPWRVLNLSRSGAGLADLLQVQLPRLRALQDDGWEAALVTAVAGGNDLRRTPLATLLDRVTALTAAVPDGTAVSTFPQGIRPAVAAAANTHLLRLAAARGLPVVDVWAATAPPFRGKYADGLHPNAVGVTDWVAAFAGALDLPREADPPRRRAD